MSRRRWSFNAFDVANHLLVGLAALLCVVPMVHLLAISFSGSGPANANLVLLWPVEPTIQAYAKTFQSPVFLNALRISVLRAVVGTGLSMAVCLAAAYALSKEPAMLRGRKFYLWFIVVTMLFNGGLIPNYILMVRLGLINRFWVFILPAIVGAYNIVLLMNFFRGLPREIEEAAYVDGASHVVTFLRIYLPMSLPVIATISLFNLVFHWNSYFDGLIYINLRNRMPLATVLQTIIVQQDFTALGAEAMKQLSQRTVRAAQIFIGALPILLVYPFLQRYFVKGIVLGAVKG